MAITERTDLERPADLAEYEIESVEDAAEAVRRARSAAERVVVAEDGEPIAAVIPIQDLYLLLRLEDQELDRLALEEIRKAEADPNDREWIPLGQVTRELGLDSSRRR